MTSSLTHLGFALLRSILILSVAGMMTIRSHGGQVLRIDDADYRKAASLHTLLTGHSRAYHGWST